MKIGAILCFLFCIRILVGLLPYSGMSPNYYHDKYVFKYFETYGWLKEILTSEEIEGYNTPPRFGDYEAQRNWMSLTIGLPLSGWYFPSEINDLGYWGLDYPPLSAFHSWVCGKVFVRYFRSPNFL